MNRPPLLIAGNWKMNKNIRETREFLNQLLNSLKTPLTCEVAIFPPFTSLPAAAEILKNTPIRYGAQNLHWKESGAFTGEIAPVFIAEIGCHYCIVGHSERRRLFGETDEICNLKVKAAQHHRLRPILCCGETLEEQRQNETFNVLHNQLEKGLKDVTIPDFDLAYEPVWAIGTGQNATPEQAEKVHRWIRDWLRNKFADYSLQVRILYGGSVKPENAHQLIAQPDVDGLLIGGASLEVNTFVAIVNSCQR
jgi:triosephosphate isomerase|uniref:Triosephosphate isomerase n=1 Tax=candidate division WOR-3 bacterium TaxID=2052148 RepID=A0A7V3PSS2_UNCW3